MVTDQDLLICRSFLVLIGSFVIFSAIGIMHPQDKTKFQRVKIAQFQEVNYLKSQTRM